MNVPCGPWARSPYAGAAYNSPCTPSDMPVGPYSNWVTGLLIDELFVFTWAYSFEVVGPPAAINRLAAREYVANRRALDMCMAPGHCSNRASDLLTRKGDRLSSPSSTTIRQT